MKKIYITPTTDVAVVNIQFNLCTASANIDPGSMTDEGEEDMDMGNNYSRRNIWDEDEKDMNMGGSHNNTWKD